MSQIQKAVDHLKANPAVHFSAQTLKATLGLACQESTLGRKLREKAAKGIISRTYRAIESGEEIAVYFVPEKLNQGELFK